MQASTSMGEARQAGPSLRGDLVGEPDQFLTFHLGEELFAVGILAIKEIIQTGSLTQVPLTPPWIRGVINLRGAVVPVIDLHARFGDRIAAVGKRSCIVILEVMHQGELQDIGILVDAVSAVVEIAAAEIRPAPAFGASVRTEFIYGMGRIEGRFVIILDIDRTFSIDEMAMLSGVGNG